MKTRCSRVRHPRRLLQDRGSGVHGLLFPVVRIEQHDASQILGSGIEHRSGNPLAIRRPRRIGISGQRHLGQHALASSVAAGNDQRGTCVGGTVAQIHHLLSVGREADRAVDVVHQLARSAAQHRDLVEKSNSGMLRLAAHEVQKVAVGRERQPAIANFDGRHDLRVAAGGDVPHPQALLAVPFVHHIDHVLAVGRNRRQHNVARVRQLLHAHVLERNRAGIAAPLHEAVVETVESGADHQHAGREHDERSALATALMVRLHELQNQRHQRWRRVRRG